MVFSNRLFNLNFLFHIFLLNRTLIIIYYKINLKSFENILNLLIFLKNKRYNLQLLKEKNANFFVESSRVAKFFCNQNFNFLNISEFVSKKQKEIYFEKKKNTFFLRNNLILQKNYINDYFYVQKIDKKILKYLLNFKNVGNFFFVQYRIYGLGFRVKKSSFYNKRSLRFDIGYGHGIYYLLPMNVKCFRRKRRFYVFSDNLFTLNFVKKHIEKFKLLNPYKIRGLKDIKYELKMKKGKKQSKK